MNIALKPLLVLAVSAAAAASAPALASPSAPRAPIKRINTSEPAVALTFDACATRTQSYTFDRAVFDILRAESVPATIFVSGRWVETHPEVMMELSTSPLVEFGGHSYQHPHMANLPAVRIAEEIDQTEAALARYGKKSVAFRPPFGEWSQRVLDVVHGKRMLTVLWDVVSGDPSARVTAEGMTTEVLRQTKPGSIVIFHINGRGLKTADALPKIVRGLRARGMRFVFLSELLARRGPPLLAATSPPPAIAPPATTPPPAAPAGRAVAASAPASAPAARTVAASAPVAAPAGRTVAASAPPAAAERPLHPDDTLPPSIDLGDKPKR